jgi:DnaK suppressor protein
MDSTAQEAKRLLSERRERLVQLFGVGEREERALNERRSPDWAEQAAEERTARLLQRLTERERAELAEIDAALARIRQGTYGSCLRCGGAIGRLRLRAVPEARFCLGCGDQD